MPVDFYELLGVERDAETSEIKQAFRQKAREYHPDVNDDERAPAQFTAIRKAYEILTDETERADYDRMGHGKYVETRLDGLTKFKFPGQAGTGDGTDDESSGRSSARSSGSDRSSSSSRSSQATESSSRRSSRRRSSNRSSRTASSRSSSSRSSASSGTSSSRSSSSRSSSSRSASSATTSSRGTSQSARGSGTGGTTGRFERESRASQSASAAKRESRNPLWYGWALSLLSLLVYAGGFGWHLVGPGSSFLSALASIEMSAPTQTLFASSALSLPTTDALQVAVSSSPTTLVLPVASVLLATSLLAVIARFGHTWTTWLYAVAAVVPAAIIAAGALGYGRPVAVDLVGLVVCPLVGAGGFVIDAGRYLFASRSR
ncbi:chaperone protein DnaJ [Haloferax mucosum ATCC BAA-1512]|uniref:Chaperone protein DnaJ n=1 Tax=Haloferax mucosum ATCC BAA-1512 TaxID=662479 RepID=M0I475_9EURY|nr:DnaJ domain-containing protein [Haloferax mucosum]ELZ91536.1 chaperone protein DnaJ [Haloferax mucosum ATCC BAA-1512]